MISTWRKWLSFMPAVLVAAGITVVSLWEAPQVPPALGLSDKTIHTLMYALLALTLMAAFLAVGRTRIAYYPIVCACVTLYGGLMELLQYCCTVTRSAEWADLLADFLGAVIGLLIIAIVHVSALRHRA